MNFGVCDEPLFDAQHVQCLHPIGTTAQFLGLGHQQSKQAFAITRRNGNLVPHFTAEGDAEQTPRNTHNVHRPALHKSKGIIADIILNKIAQQITRLGTCNGELCPLFGDGNETDVPIGVQTLGDEIQMPHHQSCSGSCGCHDIVVFIQPCSCAIIHHMPIFAQHQAITHAPNL